MFIKKKEILTKDFSSYEASLLSSGIEQDINLSEKLSAVAAVGYDLLTPIYSEGNDREARVLR
ncbi:MAG: hypothetical protein U5K00_08020 [Melioribacteraceae bacterium]|nr:hypothetical protein [Melioribacteraceae bacterium]